MGKMKTILIAEDYEPLVELYSLWLEDEYNTISAKDGQEAVDKYKEFRPDLTIMDIKLPVKEGDLAIKEILGMDKEANIIAVTAYPYSSDDLEGVEVLKKGFRRDTFMAAVKRKLDS
jgi:two-component system response regulator/two-component system chemotaxis response regulator CheY